MRAGLGHAVAALWSYAEFQKLCDHLLRGRCARNAEALQFADARKVTGFYFRQQINCVSGHTNEKGSARFNQAIDQAVATWQIHG